MSVRSAGWLMLAMGSACTGGGPGDAGSCPVGETFCGANTAWSTELSICVADAPVRCPGPSSFCGPDTTYNAGTSRCQGMSCPGAASFCGAGTSLDGGVCQAVAVDPASFCGPGTFFNAVTARCEPGDRLSNVNSGFALGSEAWSIVDLKGTTATPVDYATVVRPLDITWNPLGGVDGGGYISRRDVTTSVFFFQAPAVFLGDKSAFRQGRLQFWMRSDASDYVADARVVLIGDGGRVAVAPIPAPGAGWTRFSVSLDVTSVAWRADGPAGALLTQSQLDAVLGSLESLRINGEWGSQVTETTGLDDVQWLP